MFIDCKYILLRIACKQAPSEGRGEIWCAKQAVLHGIKNSVSEASGIFKRSESASEASGRAGELGDLVFDVPFRSMVISLLQISQEGN